LIFVILEAHRFASICDDVSELSKSAVFMLNFLFKTELYFVSSISSCFFIFQFIEEILTLFEKFWIYFLTSKLDACYDSTFAQFRSWKRTELAKLLFHE